MRFTRPRRSATPVPLLAVLALACHAGAPSAAPSTPMPSAESVPAPASKLPPMPLVQGPLVIKVVYPVAGSLVNARDSNFIFGSVGNGRATLAIDGVPVPVHPNGSFLAFLRVPDSARYELVAALGADTVRATHPVKLLPPAVVLSASGPLVVDSASVEPHARLALPDDEMVRLSLRAPANATVVWRSDSTTTVTLATGAAIGATLPVALGSGTPSGDDSTSRPAPARFAMDSDRFVTELPARMVRRPSQLIATRGADTVRLGVPAVDPPPSAQWVLVGADSSNAADVDREIVGRPIPGGTYKWFLLPGTALRLTGWSGDWARVALDDRLDIWLPASEVRPMPAGWSPPPRVAANARLVPSAGWVDLVIPMSSRPAYLVEEGDHAITLTLYGVVVNTDIVNYGANDSLVRMARWEQETSDRGRFTLQLAHQPYGYLAFWENGSFVLRVRRPPTVNRSHPLAGLTIAVDPGHPPIGATGPTGLWEPQATLAVGERVRALLQARGATVVMTRTTMSPVALADRPIMARKANANALVSIHLNALPDGMNPFTTNGTGTYFFRPQSEPLARALESALLGTMGLHNLGVNYDNLRLTRPTWMPSVLCEGAFIMIPEQEAALRTPQFQEAYARGIVDGLEQYFRALATER